MYKCFRCNSGERLFSVRMSLPPWDQAHQTSRQSNPFSRKIVLYPHCLGDDTTNEILTILLMHNTVGEIWIHLKIIIQITFYNLYYDLRIFTVIWFLTYIYYQYIFKIYYDSGWQASSRKVSSTSSRVSKLELWKPTNAVSIVPSLHFFHLHLYPFFFWFTAGPQRKLVSRLQLDDSKWFPSEVDCTPNSCIQLYMSYSKRMLSLKRINNQMCLHYSSQIIDTGIIYEYMFIVHMIQDSLLCTCLSCPQQTRINNLPLVHEHRPRQHTATGTFTIRNRGRIEIVCLRLCLPCLRCTDSFLPVFSCFSLLHIVVYAALA